jgi:hypothetical protein
MMKQRFRSVNILGFPSSSQEEMKKASLRFYEKEVGKDYFILPTYFSF